MALEHTFHLIVWFVVKIVNSRRTPDWIELNAHLKLFMKDFLKFLSLWKLRICSCKLTKFPCNHLKQIPKEKTFKKIQLMVMKILLLHGEKIYSYCFTKYTGRKDENMTEIDFWIFYILVTYQSLKVLSSTQSYRNSVKNPTR